MKSSVSGVPGHYPGKREHRGDDRRRRHLRGVDDRVAVVARDAERRFGRRLSRRGQQSRSSWFQGFEKIL